MSGGETGTGTLIPYELYNLRDDPMEATDLAARPEHEARLQRMKNELAKWQLSVTRSLNGKDYNTAEHDRKER